MKRKLARTERIGASGRTRDRTLRGEIKVLEFVAGMIESLIQFRREEQAMLRKGGRGGVKKKR